MFMRVALSRFALLLAPDAEDPTLDINGTAAQLDLVVGELQAALAARRASRTDAHETAQVNLRPLAPKAGSRA